MSTTVLQISEIASDPKIRGGKPVIRGTGLRVMDIVLRHSTGNHLTPEQIAQGYGITLGQVYAALAYYHLHKDEIDADIRRDQAEADKLLAELETQGKLLKPRIADLYPDAIRTTDDFDEPLPDEFWTGGE